MKLQQFRNFIKSKKFVELCNTYEILDRWDYGGCDGGAGFHINNKNTNEIYAVIFSPNKLTYEKKVGQVSIYKLKKTDYDSYDYINTIIVTEDTKELKKVLFEL